MRGVRQLLLARARAPFRDLPRPFLDLSPQAHALLRGRGACKLLTEGNCPLQREGASLRWLLVLMANPLLLEPQHHKPAREIGPRSGRDRAEIGPRSGRETTPRPVSPLAFLRPGPVESSGRHYWLHEDGPAGRRRGSSSGFGYSGG